MARDAGYRDGFEGQPFGHSVHKMTLAYQQGFSAGMVAVGIRETKT